MLKYLVNTEKKAPTRALTYLALNPAETTITTSPCTKYTFKTKGSAFTILSFFTVKTGEKVNHLCDSGRREQFNIKLNLTGKSCLICKFYYRKNTNSESIFFIAS